MTSPHFSMGIIFLLFLGCLAALLTIPYLLAARCRLPTRLALRTWAISFFGELAYLTFLPEEKVYQLGLQKVSGSSYLMGFLELEAFFPLVKAMLLGQANDFLALVLLPVVPALLAFLVGWLLMRLRHDRGKEKRLAKA
ncbi:hypothetical protein [Hymenobacter sp. HDW8]|uniref:hypothetical protein n=1 Tax=Hymenobacter sp. HDW8 TaxID=2714932 RepID=UPI00140A7662|nr:hypothetical protein [Hymenobacter sp. HDW8]QIL78455.1 hypothetical protein G7064_21785 [Hymenobacter sp. HDW8]